MKRSLRRIFCALLTTTLAASAVGVVAVPALAQYSGQSPWVDPQIDPNFAPKARLFARPNDIAIHARAIMPFPDRDPTGIYSEKDLRTLRWGRSPTHRLIVGEAQVPGGTLFLSEVWAGGCSNDKGGSFCPAKLVLRRPGKPDAVLFDGELSMPSGTARYDGSLPAVAHRPAKHRAEVILDLLPRIAGISEIRLHLTRPILLELLLSA